MIDEWNHFEDRTFLQSMYWFIIGERRWLDRMGTIRGVHRKFLESNHRYRLRILRSFRKQEPTFEELKDWFCHQGYK